MIVRIMTEGQYRISDDAMAVLHHLDEELLEAMLHDAKDKFYGLLGQALTLVREGAMVPTEELVQSDVVLPAEDITFDEAKKIFHDTGLA